METAIIRIAEVVQQQNTAIGSSRSMMSSIVEEVKAHRDNFQNVGMIIRVREQDIVRSGVVTQEMAQYVNAFIRENGEKSLKIANPVKEYQVQSGVLRQQLEGQRVLAEVLKVMMAGRRQEPKQPQRGVSEVGPTVTEVDDTSRTDQNFPNALSPNSGPPNNGAFGVPMNEVTQIQFNMEIVPRVQSEKALETNVRLTNEKSMRSVFLEMTCKKALTTLNVEGVDVETTRKIKRIVVLRTTTKHVNVWMRQLEMKKMQLVLWQLW